MHVRVVQCSTTVATYVAAYTNEACLLVQPRLLLLQPAVLLPAAGNFLVEGVGKKGKRDNFPRLMEEFSIRFAVSYRG